MTQMFSRIRWGVLLLVAALWIILGSQPAQAISLGDNLSDPALAGMERLRVGRGSRRYPAVHRRVDQADITAFANDQNQVFRIEIHSQADLPPDPADFVGEYGQFGSQEELIPLRARIVRYQEGNRWAEWVVYGMSGDFEAVAVSYDLAPEDVG